MPQLMQVPGQNTWLLAPPQDPSSQGKQHSLPTLQQGHGQFLLPAFMPAPARAPIRPLDFLKVNNKGPEKPSYRDFMWGAIQFALALPNEQLTGYLKHLSFLASKAKTNIFTTEALLAYDRAVHDSVDRGERIFGHSDPDLATLHLGLDGTHAMARASVDKEKKKKKTSPSNFHNTGTCTRKVCPYSHVCANCTSKDHKAPECTVKNKEYGVGQQCGSVIPHSIPTASHGSPVPAITLVETTQFGQDVPPQEPVHSGVAECFSQQEEKLPLWIPTL